MLFLFFHLPSSFFFLLRFFLTSIHNGWPLCVLRFVVTGQLTLLVAVIWHSTHKAHGFVFGIINSICKHKCQYLAYTCTILTHVCMDICNVATRTYLNKNMNILFASLQLVLNFFANWGSSIRLRGNKKKGGWLHFSQGLGDWDVCGHLVGEILHVIMDMCLCVSE